jgi:tRNA 2-thiouridine synthesizing protein E
MSNDIVDNVQTDVDGFLREGADWNEDVAFELASAERITEFTPQHWEIIRAIRAGYHAGEPDWFPSLTGICERVDAEHGCITAMFGDPVVAWRIAGLPKPAGHLDAHMP